MSTSVLENRRRLLEFQKSATGAPLYSRLINRPLGRWLAAVAHRWGATPNQATAVSALCSGVGIAAMQVEPSAFSGLVVAVALVLGYALDSADGQLARLRGGGSPAGEWLDHVVDCLKIGCFHASVLISWYRHQVFSHDAWLLLPLAFLVAAQLYFFAYVLSDTLRRIAQARGVPAAERPERHDPWWRAAVVAPTDYGVHCLLFVVWGWPVVFGGLYAVCCVGVIAYVAAGAPRWFHAMHLLGRATP